VTHVRFANQFARAIKSLGACLFGGRRLGDVRLHFLQLGTDLLGRLEVNGFPRLQLENLTRRGHVDLAAWVLLDREGSQFSPFETTVRYELLHE